MVPVRHLRNAPITEAIIDFRVKASPEVNAKKFSELQSRLADRFPKMEVQRRIRAAFEMRPDQGDVQTRHSTGIHGYRFKSNDEKTLAQFRVDGFTVNRLRPYTSWDELFPQTLELWNLYCAVAKPITVTRLALRYINRIELVGTKIDFDDYLTAGPKIPPQLPQSLSGFIVRVTIQDPETNVTAHIAQALEANPKTTDLALILDIDAFKTGEFSMDGPKIEAIFGKLRAFKNLIFFSHVREEILKGFE